MNAILRNSAFLLVPAAMLALFVAVAETPNKPLEGHAPVALWSIFLGVVGAVAFCLAAVGRLFELKWPFDRGVKLLLRVLCYGPLSLVAFMIAFVSFGYVADERGGIFSIIFSVFGLCSAGYWLIYRERAK